MSARSAAFLLLAILVGVTNDLTDIRANASVAVSRTLTLEGLPSWTGSAAGSQGQVDLATPRGLLRKAFARLQAGDAAEAERLFRAILRDNPSSFEAHRGLAEALFEQGAVGQSSDLLVRRGAQLQRSGRSLAALTLLERASEIDPGRPSARYLQGAAAQELGRYDLAVTQFRTALKLGDDQLATHLGLAASLWQRGDLRESEAAYRRALRRHDRHPLALHELGSLLMFRGRYEEALRLLREAAGTAELGSDVLVDLSRALERTGAVDESVRIARQALDATPGDPRVRYRLAAALTKAGNAQEARRHFRAYRELTAAAAEERRARKRLQAYLEEAEVLWLDGRYEKCVRLLETLTPTLRGMELGAAALAALGRHESAVILLERLARLQPERTELHNGLERERRLVNGSPLSR